MCVTSSVSRKSLRLAGANSCLINVWVSKICPKLHKFLELSANQVRIGGKLVKKTTYLPAFSQLWEREENLHLHFQNYMKQHSMKHYTLWFPPHEQKQLQENVRHKTRFSFNTLLLSQPTTKYLFWVHFLLLLHSKNVNYTQVFEACCHSCFIPTWFFICSFYSIFNDKILFTTGQTIDQLHQKHLIYFCHYGMDD